MEIEIVDKKFEKFLKSLDKTSIARTIHAINFLEKFENQLGMPHSKNIGKGLFELRVRGRREIRVIYTFKNKKAYLLHGFIKKSNRTPPKEIEFAKSKLRNLT